MYQTMQYRGPDINSYALCIPLKKNGSQWQDNELRFCLRSIGKFWEQDNICKIHLLTISPPNWINSQNVIVHECRTYEDCIRKSITIDDFLVWFNDDILLLKPTNLNDLLTIRYMSEMTPYYQKKGNKWLRKLYSARDELFELGYSPVFNFSTHTPYLFNTDLMKYVIFKFGIDNKTPLETYYYNIARNWHPAKQCDDKLTLNNNKSLPVDLAPYRFLNVFDKGLTDDVKLWLSATFPEKSPYEL